MVGSDLNLNVHLHALMVDGGYVLDDHGRSIVWVLPEPTREDLDRLAFQLCDEVMERLRRRGLRSDADDGDDRTDHEDPVNPLMGPLARASMTGTLPFGSAGSCEVTLGDPQDASVSKGKAG